MVRCAWNGILNRRLLGWGKYFAQSRVLYIVTIVTPPFLQMRNSGVDAGTMYQKVCRHLENDDVIDRDVLYGTQPLRNDGGEVGRLFFRVTSHQRLKTCSHIVAGIVED